MPTAYSATRHVERWPLWVLVTARHQSLRSGDEHYQIEPMGVVGTVSGEQPGGVVLHLLSLAGAEGYLHKGKPAGATVRAGNKHEWCRRCSTRELALEQRPEEDVVDA